MKISNKQIVEVNDDRIKANLIKDALTIIDKLSKVDVDNYLYNLDGIDEVADLIKKAKNISKNRLWKLN
jgi:hypothetical protein